MLKVEPIEGQSAVHVVSDDADAENAALNDAVELAAPHLHADFAGTEVDDEGLLKWRVQSSEYDSLLEVLDALAGDVNQYELDEASVTVERLQKAES